ncbi:sulfurtransferase-like selenium metabolism protein YedF [Enterococcus termitis]
MVVDNEVAVKNIEKMAVGLGLITTSKQVQAEERVVEIVVPKNMEQTRSEQTDRDWVVAIGRKTMGDGDSDLGELLMKSYIYALTELDTPPEHLLFFNSGAFLTNENSAALKDLKLLQEKGTQISTCGACLDFYHIKETLAIGEITNMYGIAETMAQAKKVINF